jgi:uncharacterized protein YebE (UPF0316 family)
VDVALNALLIFVLRLVDVSLATLRIVLLSRGSRWRAGLIGFFESLVWVSAAALVLANLDNRIQLVAFAFGFAAGTVVGVTIERWLALGKSILRIVVPVDSPPIAPDLRDAGFGATVLNAEGMRGEVRVVFTVLSRRQARKALSIVHGINPDAFVTLEDVTTPNLRLRRAPSVRK